MTPPPPRPPSNVGLLGQALRENSSRIMAECTAAFARESREQVNQSQLEAIQKNLPLLLDELISLLPQVMAGETATPSAVAGKIQCRAEHRLDAVIKALAGISEVVVLEFSRLKSCVADAFLADACREGRLFFDQKLAHYCLKFVNAQEPDLALRARQLEEANARWTAATETASAACHSRLQLLQGVTHELRNSLQSVLLHATSLVELPRESAGSDVVERLAISGMRLQKLLDRIQSYAPFLAGESHACLEPVDVGQFLHDLEQRHRALAITTRTRLTCQMGSGPATISTDLSKLNLIADSLVSNALHSAKEGHVQIEISASGPDQVLLTVTDDGHGIGRVEARQIFRVIHHIVGAQFQGLKLGLLASRHLTHLLGGEIAFESEEGNGASFRVALPNRAA